MSFGLWKSGRCIVLWRSGECICGTLDLDFRSRLYLCVDHICGGIPGLGCTSAMLLAAVSKSYPECGVIRL